MEDGRPKKSEHRRFTIKGNQGTDDCAADAWRCAPCRSTTALRDLGALTSILVDPRAQQPAGAASHRSRSSPIRTSA